MSEPIEFGIGRAEIPAPLEQALARHVRALHELGIEHGEPLGRVRIDPDRHRVEIGSLMVHNDGVIEIVPCEDTTLEQLIALDSEAIRAKLGTPERRRGWTAIPGYGWHVAIFEELR
ncbi:hypothetical protein [Nocardia niigatensis]|uniref:hypothetical protein n=1 Tax=Nocardia niigatensis TaxID=209249 RepID=UPI0012F68A21|nr:hypothetical protein [Nocardia niigatensis]